MKRRLILLAVLVAAGIGGYLLVLGELPLLGGGGGTPKNGATPPNGIPPNEGPSTGTGTRPDPGQRQPILPGGRGNEHTATLRYRVVERMPHGSLVEVRLVTGRKNQIRVQFAEIGCPLVGDVTYGRPSPLISRVALHSARLGFLHPHSGREMTWSSRPPSDFRRALRRLQAGERPAPGPPRLPTRPASRRMRESGRGDVSAEGEFFPSDSPKVARTPREPSKTKK